MRCNRIFLLLLTIMMAAALLAPADSAVAATAIPGSAEPSRVPQQIAPLEIPKPVEGITVPKAGASVAAPAGAEKMTFTLSSVTFDGMTAYKEADIAPLYKGLVGRTVSLTDIYTLASTLTAKYRNDGYILSQVYVPPQTIAGGKVLLRVVEGFVDKVDIQSAVLRDHVFLARYGEAIRASRPLNEKILERYLLLINDLPGVTVKSALSPSPQTPGASNLTIIIEHKPYDVALGADNRGTRYMGPMQFNTGLRLNNTAGFYEGISLQYVTAPEGRPHHEMDYGGLSITEPLGHEGTRLTLGGSVSATAPGYTLKPLDIQGIAHAYNLELMHPFLRSRSDNFFLTLKFNYLDSDRSDNLDGGAIEDRLRVLRLNALYQMADHYDGVNTLTAELSKGLNIFHTKPQGSLNMTTVSGDPLFFKGTAEASRLQHLMGSYDLFGSMTGQWSATPLLASEEFGVGGANYGSAYDASEITGKDGLAGRLELRANHPGAFRLQMFQPYGFYDLGKVWDPQNATPSARIRSLADAGFGFRAALNNAVSCSFEFAAPLTMKVASDNSIHPRLFGSLTIRF